MVDRLARPDRPQLGSYTVASVGYRVHPDADTVGQVSSGHLNLWHRDLLGASMPSKRPFEKELQSVVPGL